MDKDPTLDTKPTSFEPLVGREEPRLSQTTKPIKRENDSMDDFEHLEHEASPLDDTVNRSEPNILDVTSVQLIDVPKAPKSADSHVSDLMNVANKLERNILDTSIPADERVLQPVPATPPPSADFEKFGVVTSGSAQSLHHFGVQDAKTQQPPQVSHNRQVDTKAATMAFMDTERSSGVYHHSPQQQHSDDEDDDANPTIDLVEPSNVTKETTSPFDATFEVHDDNITARLAPDKITESSFGDESRDKNINEPFSDDFHQRSDGFVGTIESSVLPGPQKSPEFDFLADETPVEVKKISSNAGRNLMDDDTWNVVEKPEHRASSNFDKTEADVTAAAAAFASDIHVDNAPTKPLPPLPKSDMDEENEERNFGAKRINYEFGNDEKFEMSNDFMGSGGVQRGQKQQQQQSGAETGDSEFESAPEQSPAKSSSRIAGAGGAQSSYTRKVNADDIAPKEIFTDMGLDAWFNPERLNPKVASLIYWRQPEKTGIVFGAILGVLLSLAYFSLISVFAYLSLLTLTGTVGFRIYKTFMQAVQKTSDGHPFKDILDVDLTLPAEKVHEVADVAVAHANAGVAELRRLFLVEDFIDSLKFGALLWSLTYVGAWFNGMTLIIIGVVALFTLPKVYETNKAQIDQNVALVQGKINELTAKVKAAIPLGKKSEPTKEE